MIKIVFRWFVLNVIYIKETEDTCDIIKRIIIKIKKKLNIIKIENINNKITYLLPIFKESKISKYRVKRFCNQINKILDRNGSNTVVLSENLNNNQLLKNYLFAKNINILNGRFLFKCLTYKILEYIYKIKNEAIELRRSFCIN